MFEDQYGHKRLKNNDIYQKYILELWHEMIYVYQEALGKWI